MGRYPFLVKAKAYCQAFKPRLLERSYRDLECKMDYLWNAVQDGHVQGEIDTTNPVRFGEKEIAYLEQWMQDRQLALTTRANLWSCLKRFLSFCDNAILERMKAEGKWKAPKPLPKPLHVKDDAWFQDAMGKLGQHDDWESVVVRTAIAIHYHTGLRVKELRLASLNDLNLREWTLAIKHPKGEGSYATEGEKVGIFPCIRQMIRDYLDQRAVYMKRAGLDSETVRPLFPKWDGTYYPDASWRTIRIRTLKKVGIEGNYQILRPTFAQKLHDNGASIDSVSKALRHTTTVTTQRYYARIRTKQSWAELEQIWERPIRISIRAD